MALASNIPKDPKKETIYVDVDDEITAIIEKVQNTTQPIVALVLPKRATVMQSVVNMKLLKRTADNAKKRLVLITSEANLFPLAGAVGMHVASTLQSKPAIPPAPNDGPLEQTVDEATGETVDDFDAAQSADRPIGALAGGAVGVAAASGSAGDQPETIQLDNADAPSELSDTTADSKPVKPKKDKKLLIPNFNRFRLLLVCGAALLILLGAGFIYANIALAKATVTLKTNSTDVATRATLSLDPSSDQVDLASSTVPAKIASKSQTGSQQVSTSGQKNNGTKASGSVTITNCNKDATSVTIPAGTGVSSGSNTYITQKTVTLATSYFSGNNCRSVLDATQDVDVIAQTAGASGNIQPTTFSVAGFGNVTAKSSDPMTGGTDNIVKVVTQADIDSAKAKISAADSGSIKQDLIGNLQSSGYVAIATSLKAGDPTVTSSAAAGDQADTVTVTQVTAYTMYGVKMDDIKSLITANVEKQIDTSKQKILNNGVESAKYDIVNPATSGPLQVNFSATSLAGPDINIDKLASQMAGKKTSEIRTIVTAIPGVSDATVKYSPFWNSSAPKNTKKIVIDIQKSSGETTTTRANGSN